MINNQTVLCLMLARGGSKGVPNKNIKLLNDKPLIYYTIQSVKEAKIFDKFILSTDSSEIGDIAINYGVEVPFLDDTGFNRFIQHMRQEKKKQGE